LIELLSKHQMSNGRREVDEELFMRSEINHNAPCIGVVDEQEVF